MPLLRVLGPALLLVGVAGCMVDGGEPIDSVSESIVGGGNAFPHEFPAVMGLYDGVHLCTATLIHPEWAITAAHCVTPSLTGHATQAEVTAAFYVLFDDVDLTDQSVTSRRVNLSETITHPDWNPSKLGDNDLALLHLAQPVTDRAPSPVHRIPVANGTPVTQVGYGVSDPVGQTGAGILRVLNTVTADCDQYGRSDINLLCFDAQDGNGTCFGDSGGPTFVTVGGTLEVAGVTSFGANDQCTGYDAATHTIAGEIAFVDAHVPKIAGGIPQASDPQAAATPIGPAPTVLTGCSVGGAHAARGMDGPFTALAILCLVSWHRRRRAPACTSDRSRPHS